MQNKNAIFLMGPTASGKTALAMRLAQQLPLDIISVDSAMVYRGMNIGTGKPTRSELLQSPHALVDICDPSDPYSVARFCDDAREAMLASWTKGRIPILVGGTMLYFKALKFGLSNLPAADAKLRSEIMESGKIYMRLAKLDPEAAARLNPNDTQRIQRALEINILTGKTLQENYQDRIQQQPDFHVHSFAVIPSERARLHQDIAQRFDNMLDAGLVREVEQLFNRGDLDKGLPAIRSVGYRQVWNYLEQNIVFSEMREQAIAATRQLAKRQYTWLRSWADVTTLTNAASKESLNTIVKFVDSMLNSKTI